MIFFLYSLAIADVGTWPVIKTPFIKVNRKNL